MKSMRSFTRRTLVVATATALSLYVGMLPDDFQSDKGMSAVGLVYAAGAGQRGGGSSHSGGGSSHDHDDSSHIDHDDSSHTDHDDSSHDDSSHDGGHAASGGKRKGPKYQGGKSASGSTKGRGAGSQAVIEKIFEFE